MSERRILARELIRDLSEEEVRLVSGGDSTDTGSECKSDPDEQAPDAYSYDPPYDDGGSYSNDEPDDIIETDPYYDDRFEDS